MKKFIKYIMALVILVSFVGCSPNIDNPQSSSEDISSVTTTAETEVTEQMIELATLYDIYCGGVYQNSSDGFELSIGYIEKNNELNNYINNDIYSFPIKECEDAAAFLLTDFSHSDSTASKSYSLDFLRLSTKLTVKSAEMVDNQINVTFSRESENARLNDAIYVFSKAVAQNVPEILQKNYKAGEEYYKISAVKNIPISLNENQKTVEIGNANEFLDFVKDVNENGRYEIGNTYLLTADLDLNGIDFEPIGNANFSPYNEMVDSAQAGFNGIFDGQGHKISGVKMTLYDSQEMQGYNGYGFFGVIGQYGIVKNLSLADCVIKTENEFLPVGILAGISYGVAENCNVSGKVSGINAVGGLIGRATEYRNVSYDAASAITRISNCSAEVEVSGNSAIGGLAGEAYNISIEGSIVSGTVTAVENIQEIGGFLGSMFFCSINNCKSNMKINIMQTGKWIGAFAGVSNRCAAYNCAYNKQKAGNWDIIDMVDDVNAISYDGYDIADSII